MASPSSVPPQPSAFFSSFSQFSSSIGLIPSCSTAVTSLPPRPFLSIRTTALAGPMAGPLGSGSGAGCCSGRSLSLPRIPTKGLLNGLSSLIRANFLRRFPDGGKEPVGAVAVRQELHRADPAQPRVGPLERVRHGLVLGAVQSAGGIDEALLRQAGR